MTMPQPSLLTDPLAAPGPRPTSRPNEIRNTRIVPPHMLCGKHATAVHLAV
jgi:hypothetical protein